MTYYEKMVQWLKDILSKCENGQERGFILTAIMCTEKQILKKAVGDHYARMRCPSCNHRIPSGKGSSSRRRDNWCNYCGQKIDWSDLNGD